MSNVVFVAPFFMETTLRFVHAVAKLPGVRLALVSQDPLEKLDGTIRGKLATHVQVDDALDPGRILDAIRVVQGRLGPVDRLVGTLEELQVPLGQLRDHLGLPGLGEAAAHNFRDKAQMKSVLKEHGLPCATHGLARSTEEATGLAPRIGFPLVVKPPDGAGARGTFRVDDADQLATALRATPPTPEHPVLLEEFIQGPEHSFDSVCIGGQLVWYSINHYTPGPLEVLREPWIQWAVLLPRETDAPEYAPIVEAARAALPILGLDTGLSHMEWFQRPDGSVAISEVGARPPGAQFTSLISWAHDFDLYLAWARLMVFDRFDPPTRPYAAGAVYLRAQGQGRVKAVHGVEELARELGSVVVEARLPRPGQPTSGTYEGEGVVLVRHPETAVVRDALGRILRGIRVELA